MDQSAPRLSGAPNITGRFASYSWDKTSDGAFTNEYTASGAVLGGSDWFQTIRMSSSRSSTVYQDGLDKLYPNHYAVRYYIRYR